MQFYDPYLQWIDHQKEHMTSLLTEWVNINSHSHNIEGLDRQLQSIKEHFKDLHANIQELSLPPATQVDNQGNIVKLPLGKALLITKRTDSKFSVLFSGHMDTVYPIDSPFQRASKKDENTLIGPGSSDMKGGLVILLTALQAFEKSPYATKIGWEVLITPDEEIGSTGSKDILERAAERNVYGFVFEPSFPDGTLVSERSGSHNLLVVFRGKAAHAGRDFHSGKSALFAIAPFIVAIKEMNVSSKDSPDVSINVGQLSSGSSYNIVPDLSFAKINIRTDSPKLMQEIKEKIIFIAKEAAEKDGVQCEIHEISSRPPKVLDEKTQKLFSFLEEAGSHLGVKIQKKRTRGVSDGNILAFHGLPTIDTLGAIGGELHTEREYVLLDSLTHRAKLCALFLMKLANGEFLEQK